MKKCLLFLLCVLFATIGNAQECKTLNEDAIRLFNEGKTSEALLKAEKACSVCKLLGEEHPDYETSLNNLAALYNAIGDYKNAEPLYIQALAILIKILGEEHPSYATSLNSLARLYYDIGDYKKAEPLYIQALVISKKVLGEEHPDYATSLNDLAGLYHAIGDYKKTQPLYIQALAIYKKVLGEEHPSYANSLNNLAVLYSATGFYKKAEPLYLQALAIRKKVLGEDHPDYAKSLNSLAGLYKTIGDYKKAEPLYIQVLAIQKKILGEEHPDYATSINNIASFYKTIGDYKKAEPLYIQALAIRKKVLGEDHPDYATSLNNLALFYKTIGDYKKAEPLYIQALAIRKKVLGEEHPSYAASLNNLAGLYDDIGDYKKAEPLYLQALAIRKNVLGEDHPDYATSLNNLAGLYDDIGDYKKAEPLYIQALAILKKVFGEEHPSYATSLNNLALLYYYIGDYKKAESVNLKDYNITSNNIKDNLSFLSITQSTNFLKSKEWESEILYSSLNINPESTLKDSLINFNYFIKGVLLQNSDRLSNIASNSTDESVKTNWTSYKDYKMQIAKLYQQPKDKQGKLAELQEQADKLEKQLMQQMPEFQVQLKNNNIKWQQVQSTLTNDEAAIEFVNFQYRNKEWTDTTFYAAYIVKKGITHPIFINCFQEKDLIAILDKPNTNSGINTIYRGGKILNAMDSSQQYALYNLIWAPIDSNLQGIKRIYLSPSGLLHRVAFAAITTPENKKLLQQYELHIMSNTRALAESKSVKTNNSSMALLGGIDYEQQAANNLNSNTEEIETLADFKLASLRGGTQEKWNFLAGTKSEAAQLKKAMATTNMSTTLYTGSQASEELLKAMGTGKIAVPNILHIATHGFALPIPEVVHKDNDRMMMDATNTPSFSTSEDPLTRAGLVLAGANKMWTTGKPYPNKEDGILTAREIAELDLRNCNLAVLSACETGLGELKGSEGVFGLQRAFKMTGVHNLIISLWSVPDAETSEFMQLFYNNWLQNKMEIHQAFTETQLAMSAKYEVYKWAAFVLVE